MFDLPFWSQALIVFVGCTLIFLMTFYNVTGLDEPEPLVQGWRSLWLMNFIRMLRVPAFYINPVLGFVSILLLHLKLELLGWIVFLLPVVTGILLIFFILLYLKIKPN
jgi:hypothetical protein